MQVIPDGRGSRLLFQDRHSARHYASNPEPSGGTGRIVYDRVEQYIRPYLPCASGSWQRNVSPVCFAVRRTFVVVIS